MEAVRTRQLRSRRTNDHGDDLLRAALRYAKRGWHVFPVNGKTPFAGTKGFHDATTDVAQITKWWREHPDANIAIALKASGLVVVDIDGPEGASVVAALGLPVTRRVLTGMKGEHHYFLANGLTIGRNIKVRPQLDLLGDGYVLAPPSIHPETGNRYRLLDKTKVQPLPAQVIALIKEQPTAIGQAAPLPEVIAEGERDDLLTRLAGTLRNKGCKWPEILEHLEITNRRRCLPPLGIAQLKKIAKSIGRKTVRTEGNPARQALPLTMMDLVASVGVELFHDADGGAFATLPVGSHRETHSLNGGGFRGWLAHRTFEQLKRVPSDTQLHEVLNILAHQARNGPTYPAPVRIAEHSGRLYVDLGDSTWQAVEIDKYGWRVVAQPPVRFQRSRNILPLPVPAPGGSLDDLWQFCNVAEGDRPLFVAFLLGALSAIGPYPVLDLVGAPGNGKSSTAEYAKRLVDPCEPLTRAQPRNEEDLLIAARRTQLIVLDNLSWAPEWMVDALCRLATGAGQGKRQQYTNDDEWVLKAMRPVMITSLGGIATRADLLDRSIVLDLPMLPRASRRTKQSLDRLFEESHPALFGALLDVMVVGWRYLPGTKLRGDIPRMADFARWAVACESALPWPSGTFLKRYAANQAGRQKTALESHLFIPHLIAVVRGAGNNWRGSITQLLEEVNRRAEEKVYAITRRKAWPQGARWLSGRLSELQRALEEQRGLSMKWGRSGSKRWIDITLDEPA